MKILLGSCHLNDQMIKVKITLCSFKKNQSFEFHPPQSLVQQITRIMLDLENNGELKRPKQDRLIELQS